MPINLLSVEVEFAQRVVRVKTLGRTKEDKKKKKKKKKNYAVICTDTEYLIW